MSDAAIYKLQNMRNSHAYKSDDNLAGIIYALLADNCIFPTLSRRTNVNIRWCFFILAVSHTSHFELLRCVQLRVVKTTRVKIINLAISGKDSLNEETFH